MKGISYQEKKLDEDFTRETLLESFPNVKTYPVVVVDGMEVGGFEGLKSYLSEETRESRKFLAG